VLFVCTLVSSIYLTFWSVRTIYRLLTADAGALMNTKAVKGAKLSPLWNIKQSLDRDAGVDCSPAKGFPSWFAITGQCCLTIISVIKIPDVVFISLTAVIFISHLSSVRCPSRVHSPYRHWYHGGSRSWRVLESTLVGVDVETGSVISLYSR
jgi:hypothetical protein